MIKPAKKHVLIYTGLVLAAFVAVLFIAEYFNITAAVKDQIEANMKSPVFSRESGFYSDDFDLEMECEEGSVIYYTLDGSTPDTDSIKYDGPLHITDATPNENVYSMNTDISTGFYTDLIEKYSTRDVPGYIAPEQPVDKCTIIRAVCADSDGDISPETTGTYFVGKDPSDYGVDYIVSLVTDPDNLFDDEIGIYVTGDRFSNYVNNNVTDWHVWAANYWLRGEDWQRDADVQIFASDGTAKASSLCRIGLHGTKSRSFSQKGLNIAFTDNAGNAKPLGADLIGNGYFPESITASAGGNNNKFKFNNYAVNEVLGDDELAFPNKSAVIFIDGEYWGFYWITEKPDAAWFEHYYGVNRNNIEAVKFKQEGHMLVAITSTVEGSGKAADDLYKQMEQFVTTHDMSDDDNYKTACDYIDIDNYIDYFAVEIYIANIDWPHRNKELWRVDEAGDGNGDGSDGRWRCILYDMDLAMQSRYASHDTLSHAIDKDDVFASLWNNKSFREQFEKRIKYYGDNCFSADIMIPFIDNYVDEYGSALKKSWTRFYDSDHANEELLKVNMDDLKDFFNNRRQTVDAWF